MSADQGQYQPCNAECNGCPTCDPGLAIDQGRAEALSADDLTTWLHEWVKVHSATDFRDTGHSLVLECVCGADLGIRYSPTQSGDPEAEARAYFRHQADDLAALRAEWAAAMIQAVWDRADDGIEFGPKNMILLKRILADVAALATQPGEPT